MPQVWSVHECLSNWQLLSLLDRRLVSKRDDGTNTCDVKKTWNVIFSRTYNRFGQLSKRGIPSVPVSGLVAAHRNLGYHEHTGTAKRLNLVKHIFEIIEIGCCDHSRLTRSVRHGIQECYPWTARVVRYSELVLPTFVYARLYAILYANM